MLSSSEPSFSPAARWRSPHGRTLPATGGRTLLMGILNVTPDSFSDGGQLASIDAITARAEAMLAGGADVLDLGGESTRPGAAPVSAEEELARVLPAIAALRRRWPDVPLSIDTFKADVARAAIAAGADVVNDVWGLTHGLSAEDRVRWRAEIAGGATTGVRPTAMAQAVADLGCPVIAMHNRPVAAYDSFWDDILLDLKLSIALARRAGLADAQIWLDPGFGFAKNIAQNLAVIRDLHRIVALGFPVLVGTSRKSTLGRILDAPVDQRLDGTGATVTWAIQQGCSMIRVHDVAEMRRFARVADALKAGIDFTLS